jgi:hypothetical protein
MRKFGFLLFLSNLCLGLSLHAQITNGSFSGGLSGWTQLGAPTASGGTAIITSTDATPHDTGAPDAPGSDTASDIQTTLGVVLPNTNDIFAPTDGQAIFQEFSLSSSNQVTFTYSSSSDDDSVFDGVGYSITRVSDISLGDPYPGTFYSLSNSIVSTSVTSTELSAGTYFLAFVAYNTSDNQYATTINVSDVALAEAPEPSTILLLTCGLGLGLLLFRSRRVQKD